MSLLLVLAAIPLILLILYYIHPVTHFYVKLFLYGLCVIAASAVGFFWSIPYGITTDNHFRIFATFHAFTRWMGIKYVIENQELLDGDEPYIIIANHQSALDVLTMTQIWPHNCVVLLKRSLQYVPFFNGCTWLSRAVFVDRFDKTKAHLSIESARKSIEQYRTKIFIYAEGTRSAKEDLLPFKKGAFIISKQCNVPIVPVVFSSYKPFYDHSQRKFLDEGTVTIRVLPKVYPKEDVDVGDYAEELRQQMNATFKEMSGFSK